MKTLILTAMFFMSLGSQLALAHGEDKPGPHGGFIRMPGAFHTEVVPTSPNSLKVYLLDIEWKNPSVKGASVSVMHKGTKITKQECALEANYYVCQFPKNIDLEKKGKLIVEAQRESQKGNVVSYELPLKLQVVDDGHGGHH